MIEATIRKWFGKYGFAAGLSTPTVKPPLYYVHISKCSTPEKLGIGVRIRFSLGEPRVPNEPPPALNIEIVSAGVDSLSGAVRS
jgi:hypothetical protein